MKRPRSTAVFLAAVFLVACDDEPAEQVPGDPGQLPVSAQCAACHAEQYRAWQTSDHAWAYRSVQEKRDRQPFSKQGLTAHGERLLFTRDKNGSPCVQSLPKGRIEKVVGVVGRTPLRQYLVEGANGAQQVLSAAWDTGKREWFDVFADDERLRAQGGAQRKPSDWGHRLGRGMNWNSQCARCHVSGFAKNYEMTTDSYRSRWKEPGVTCISCHPVADQPDAKDGCLVARKSRRLSEKQVRDTCASCHARSEEFDDSFRPGDNFEDHFRLELPLLSDVFWANGMQRDEVFVETGFRLSRMGAAGVTCLDCHDKASGQLILPLEDNSLCLRCHATGEEVHGTKAPLSSGAPDGTCPKDSMGGRCVECHMPESKYMARDPRRDHSMNIPDPELSTQIPVPNSCTMCHRDRDDAWAADVLRRVLPKQKMEARRPRTRAVYAATQGQGSARDLLAALEREDVPAWRATLLELLARVDIPSPILSRAVQQAAASAAADPDAMVRAAAAAIPGPHTEKLLNDPVRAVRHAAAWTLLPRRYDVLRGTRALTEITAAAQHRADQPSGAMQLAALAVARGDAQEALAQYDRAIRLDPASPVPYMDCAVLLAQLGRPVEALQRMLDCVRIAPQNAEVQYRLALALLEVGQKPAAATALQRALDSNPHHAAARETLMKLQTILQQQP